MVVVSLVHVSRAGRTGTFATVVRWEADVQSVLGRRLLGDRYVLPEEVCLCCLSCACCGAGSTVNVEALSSDCVDRVIVRTDDVEKKIRGEGSAV